MIRLIVEDYCDDCPDFEPEVEKEVDSYSHFSNWRFEKFDTTVTCSHANRCRCIKNYLKSESKKEK